MSDIVLLIDDLRSCSTIYACRICLEEEFESLEAPCACSGTLKFAHRDCIQRWCNEKGNTSCEICLQTFEPGYTIPFEKKELIETTVTVSGTLRENPGEIIQNDYYSEYAADKTSVCCRLVALIFTSLLLIRHLVAVLTGEAEGYPFSVLTMFVQVLMVKASAILIPMYILLQIIASMNTNHQYQNRDLLNSDDEDDKDEDEERQNVEEMQA